jgi:hypothetical protein
MLTGRISESVVVGGGAPVAGVDADVMIPSAVDAFGAGEDDVVGTNGM